MGVVAANEHTTPIKASAMSRMMPDTNARKEEPPERDTRDEERDAQMTQPMISNARSAP